MGIFDDLGDKPLSQAEKYDKKGYYTYILIGLILFFIWLIFLK